MSRRGWTLFLAMSVIWGIPYLLIKVAVEDLEPATLVLARVGVAALLLTPLAVRRGELRPLVPRWRPLTLYTLVELCIPWYFLAYAERTLSSSLTGLLVAAVPLVGAALVVVTGHERLGGRRIVGLLLGFLGVAALVGVDLVGNVTAVAAVGVVVVCYAVGPFILATQLSDQSGTGVVSWSLLLALAVYLVPGVVQAPDRLPAARVLASVLTLAVVCTALAFVLFFQLIAEVGPARATVITYVNPAVAVLLGSTVLDEPITLATLAGFALIIAGSVLGTGRDRPLEPSVGEP